MKFCILSIIICLKLFNLSLALPFTPTLPIVLVHGLLKGPQEFDEFKVILKQFKPETDLFILDSFNHYSSLEQMSYQVNHISEKLKNVTKNFSNGYNLICFSQGGLICRAYIEQTDNHNVHNFISLSSPQAGQYGDTSYFSNIKMLTKDIYFVFYSLLGQKLSIANYWKDPHHLALYRSYCNFLPFINNEILTKDSTRHKANLLKLNNLIAIGGPDDGIITPWQSSQFGFFDENEKIINYENMTYYKLDTFGLKTLHKQNKLHFCTMSGITHHSWHTNVTVFKNCILQWLD